MKSVNLNFLEPSGPLQACNGTALPFINPKRGPGSSVGIAADYELDGSGSNPGADEIFRQSRPALGSTQPPVKWISGLFRGKVRPGRAADHSSPSSAAVMQG